MVVFLLQRCATCSHVKRYLGCRDLIKLAGAAKHCEWTLAEALSLPGVQVCVGKCCNVVKLAGAANVRLLLQSGPLCPECPFGAAKFVLHFNAYQIARGLLTKMELSFSRLSQSFVAFDFDLTAVDPCHVCWIGTALHMQHPQSKHVGMTISRLPRTCSQMHGLQAWLTASNGHVVSMYDGFKNMSLESFRFECACAGWGPSALKQMMHQLPVPTMACDVLLAEVADTQVAIAALNALYDNYVDSLWTRFYMDTLRSIGSSATWKYDICIEFTPVECDDKWEGIRGEVADALRKFFVWSWFAAVTFTLHGGGAPAEGLHLFEDVFKSRRGDAFICR